MKTDSDYTFRLVVHTQVMELYGSDQWKPKGSDSYLVANLTVNEVVSLGTEGLANMVFRRVGKILINNQVCHEYVVDWELLDRGELTLDEQTQIECDGSISYPLKELTA